MMKNCLICGTKYDHPIRGWYEDYVMKVCSGPCFSKALRWSYRDFGQRVTVERLQPLIEKGKVKVNEDLPTARSGFETRFARVLLRDCEEAYETALAEPFIFYFEDKSGYLPDVLVNGLFFEVKGLWLGQAKTKFRKFVTEYRFPIFVVDEKALRRLEVR